MSHQLPVTKIEDGQVAPSFDGVERLAEQYGLRSYMRWRADWERRCERMPSWYWDEVRRRAHYTKYVMDEVRRSEAGAP